MQSNFKTYFCPDAYACMVVKECRKNPFTESPGHRVRRCPKANCRGAHNEEEMKTKSFISKFNNLDYSKLQLGLYYEAIHTVLNEAVGKISDTSIAAKLGKLKKLNFVEMLQLWVETYMWISAEKKKGNRRLPKMSIDNHSKGIIEDHMWALERLTKMCPKHMQVIDKINSQEHLTIRDTCLGGFNCKFGCHRKSQMVSIDDILYGTDADPFTEEMYLKKIGEINKSIEGFKKKIQDMESTVKKLKDSLKSKSNDESKSSDYKTVVSKGSKNLNGKTLRKIADLENKIARFNKIIFFKREREIKNIPRMRRLTKQGLEPICFYLERKKKADDERKAKMESSQDVSKKSRKKVRKPKF